jgi:hypothetical protein
MIATYPMDNAFLKDTNKAADPGRSGKKAKKAFETGLGRRRIHRDASGFPEDEDDNYHLGRLIYTL